MPETTFNVGDVVQLKSGSPLLTVESTNGEKITCVWFEGKKQQRNVFVSQTLTKSGGRGPMGFVVA